MNFANEKACSQGFSWLFRPFANLFMRKAKQLLTSPDIVGLILCSRAALTMWEGVRDTPWSFLSPPWQLRDKGNTQAQMISKSHPAIASNNSNQLGIRTGKYEVHVDDYSGSAENGINHGVYNEDMAVAIVDEIENQKLNHKHWTCTGPIGLKEW